eukprot:TRINITY_DN6445_c0_g1_i7.p1 TRINITY_DN6445_c0_g1~~TRINITY_DN6445_c0_g1_i7.p1  ORF type:complete len:387 (-),score=39.89 TRINITY_DN6445_c0_g1_i7:611-1771(-)
MSIGFGKVVIPSAGVLAILCIYGGMGCSVSSGMYAWSVALCAPALVPSYFWERIRGRHASGHLQLYYDPVYPHSRTVLHYAKVFLALDAEICDATTTEHGDASQEHPRVIQLLRRRRCVWGVSGLAGDVKMEEEGVHTLITSSPLTAALFRAPRWLRRLSWWLFGVWYGVVSLLTVIAFMMPGTAPHTPVPTHREHPPDPSYTDRSRAMRVFVRVTSVSPFHVAAFLLSLYVVWWNIGAVEPAHRMPEGMEGLAYALRLDQWWGTWAPFPPKDNGWFVVAGKLQNGREVDVWRHGQGLTTDKPPDLASSYRNIRWRQYMMHVYTSQQSRVRASLGRYFCREWNWYGPGAADKFRLKSFKIVFFRETTLPNNKMRGPEPLILWDHTC